MSFNEKRIKEIHSFNKSLNYINLKNKKVNPPPLDISNITKRKKWMKNGSNKDIVDLNGINPKIRTFMQYDKMKKQFLSHDKT